MLRFFGIMVTALVVQTLTGHASNDGQCLDDPQTRFEWQWCASDTSSSTTFDEICFGQAFYTDIAFKAVQFKYANGEGSEKYECLFDKGSWQNVSWAGCPNAIEREYHPVYGADTVTLITECQVQGNISKIKGTTLRGISFHATKPSP